VSRYAVYGVPGIEPGAPAVAVRLRAAVESWYRERPDVTVDPRRYGFHATLKAPFSLAEGVTPAVLEAAVSDFAAQHDAVMLPAVRPKVIGSFRALVPTGDAAQVDALEAEVVRALEPLRAPLTEADIARRRPEQLTARQRELLDDVGYPYALDEFRCHLTLTDSISGESTDAVDAAIAAHFADFDGVDVPLGALAVFEEPHRGEPFRIHSIHPFRESA